MEREPFRRAIASAPTIILPLVLFLARVSGALGFPFSGTALDRAMLFSRAALDGIPRDHIRMDVGDTVRPRAPPRGVVDDHHVLVPAEPRCAPTPRRECRTDSHAEA